jgi:hypothetical protein
MSFSIEEPAGVIKFVGFSVPSPSQNLISIKILDLIKRWYSTGL